MNHGSSIVSDANHPLADLAKRLGVRPRMKVSLDQNFLWNFADPKKPEVVRLRDAIRCGVQAKKFICPLHMDETVFESALLPAELRSAIFAIAEELSGGLAFHHFAGLAQVDTLMVVRHDLAVPGLRRGSLRLLPDTDVAALASENRMAKEKYQERLDQHPYPPKSYDPKMTRDEVHRGIVSERAGSMYRVVTSIRKSGSLDTGKPEWEIATAVGGFLLEAKIGVGECDRLLQAIVNHEWERTPALFAHSNLCAQLEWDYLKAARRGRSNDYLDISRLAVALNDANVVLCDHAMVSVVRRTVLAKDPSAPQVFSMRELAAATGFFESRL